MWACTSLIADSIATLPRGIFAESEDGTRKPAARLEWLDKPNPEQTWIDFVFGIVVSLLLDGNAFIFTVRDRVGDVVEAWCIDPQYVYVIREQFEGKLQIVYYMQVAQGTQSPLPAMRVPAGPSMFHIPAYVTGVNNPRGLSPLEINRQMLGGAIAGQEMGARFFGQGMNAGGVIEVPGDLPIEQARELEALSQAATQITRMIALMQRSGMRVALIARLVQQLNAQLFERAWQIVAPAELVANSCLFVMGSEGRGEQLLKTDQDNGLILRDGYSPPADLDAICARFSQALADFGYPECPGRIMVSNPDWRAPLAEFSRQLREWLILPDPDSLMKLAIFMDAHAVCGDAALLRQAREAVLALAPDNQAVLARFASAITAFGESQGWWNKLFSLGEADSGLDLKKEGIFPLVHGVRSLALARRLAETGTASRIAALVADGQLDAAMGAELTDCLSFFMGLKLKAGLAEIDTGRAVTGRIDPAQLSPLERDLLKDTLAAVKRFKALLRQRFHLDAM